MSREFKTDFLEPALVGLNKQESMRVAIALDAAICFGALEHAEGNESMQDLEVIRRKYQENVERLAKKKRWL